MVGLIIFISIVIFLVFIFVSMFTTNKKREKAAITSITNIEMELIQARKDIIFITGSQIEGREVLSVIGGVRGISKTQATGAAEFELSEKEALLSLLNEARQLGANGVVDVKLNTGTYEKQGSRWQVSQSIYTGTAVLLEDI